MHNPLKIGNFHILYIYLLINVNQSYTNPFRTVTLLLKLLLGVAKLQKYLKGLGLLQGNIQGPEIKHQKEND